MKTTRVYDHYYRYGEITDILQEYAEKYPGFTRLTSLTRTAEGRELWMLAVTDTSAGAFEQKPTYVASGNIHAGEVAGSMCVMYFLDYLFTNLETDPAIQRLLREYTIYAIPRVSMDGSEFYLTSAGSCRSVNIPYPPADDLPDGIYSEDLDGDGIARLMRIRDPQGLWKVCEEDDRLMVRRAPDELEGEFYSVFHEGKIKGNPDTCRFNAPDPYAYDFNRCFPNEWRTDDKQLGAGPYPLYFAEVRALADLMVEQKNICSFLVYHTCAGCFLYPPGWAPTKEATRDDLSRYQAVGRIATEETAYPTVNIYDAFSAGRERPNGGSFDDYVHFARGIFSMAAELWDLDLRAGVAKGKWERRFETETPEQHLEDEKKMIAWIDKNLGPDTFKPWTAFEHPQLGAVEIGGYDLKYVMQNPPIPFLLQELEKCTRFMLRQVKTLPRLEIERTAVRRVSEGLYEVEAVAANHRYFPTSMTSEAVRLGILDEDCIQLDGDVEFISGKPRESIGFLPGKSGIHAVNEFGDYKWSAPKPLTASVAWIVKAAKGTKIDITAVSVRGGRDVATLLLD